MEWAVETTKYLMVRHISMNPEIGAEIMLINADQH
jgi:hypothetical protein